MNADGNRGAAVAAAVIVLAAAVPAFALPEGESVAAGQVSFARGENSLTVMQNSGRAIVNYDSFNIAAPESVRFVQPGPSAAILNRVTGNKASAIAGALNANGNVYLVNPNGILFSPTARVNVHSLVASALDIGDSDFLSGNMKFQGGRLGLSSRSPDVGEGQVELDVSYEGADLEIAFNPDYLLDVLRALGGGELKFKLKDSSSAALIDPGNNYIYVIMPVSIG